jgi:hypothetical protein
MATVGVYYATIGKYYELVEENGKTLETPEYLGKYERMDGEERSGGPGGVKTSRPIYVFEKKTIKDNRIMEKVREVEKRGGKRRKSRHRKSRRSRKTARK